MERCFDISSERNLISFEFLSRFAWKRFRDRWFEDPSNENCCRLVEEIMTELIAKLFSLPNFSFVIYSVTRVTFPCHLSSSCLSANERHQKRQKRNWGKRVPSSVTIGRSAFRIRPSLGRREIDRFTERNDQTPFFLLLLLLSSNVKESIVIERWIRSWVG